MTSAELLTLEGNEFYAAVTRHLIETGVDLVNELKTDPALSAAAKAEPYERYSRALRRSIALGRFIDDNPSKPAQTSRAGYTLARTAAIRDIEPLLQDSIKDLDRRESLRDELYERLDDPAFQRDLATRPLADIIRDLKRDFGIYQYDDVKPIRRTPADIRALAAGRRPAPPPQAAFARPRRYIPEHPPTTN